MRYYTNITGKSQLKQNIFLHRLVKSTTVRQLSVKFHGAALLNSVCTAHNGTAALLLLAMLAMFTFRNSSILQSSFKAASPPIEYKFFPYFTEYSSVTTVRKSKLFEKYPSYIQVCYYVSFTFRY